MVFIVIFIIIIIIIIRSPPSERIQAENVKTEKPLNKFYLNLYLEKSTERRFAVKFSTWQNIVSNYLHTSKVSFFLPSRLIPFVIVPPPVKHQRWFLPRLFIEIILFITNVNNNYDNTFIELKFQERDEKRRSISNDVTITFLN